MSVKTVLDSFSVTGFALGSSLSTGGRLKDATWTVEADGQLSMTLDFDVLMQDGTWATNVYAQNTGSVAATFVASTASDLSRTGLCLPGSLADELIIFGIRCRTTITSILNPVKVQISAIDE